MQLIFERLNRSRYNAKITRRPSSLLHDDSLGRMEILQLSSARYAASFATDYTQQGIYNKVNAR